MKIEILVEQDHSDFEAMVQDRLTVLERDYEILDVKFTIVATGNAQYIVQTQRAYITYR